MPAIGGTVGKAEASEHNLPRYIPGSLVLSLVHRQRFPHDHTLQCPRCTTSSGVCGPGQLYLELARVGGFTG